MSNQTRSVTLSEPVARLGAGLEAGLALAAEWGALEPKGEMIAAWVGRKAELTRALCRLLGQMSERGLCSGSPGALVGALGLESMLTLAGVGWLDARERGRLMSYAKGLVGFEPGQPEQGEAVQEQHEWMRFEIASAILSRQGQRSDQAGIEAACREMDWNRVPMTLCEWAAREERFELSQALPPAPEGAERGRL